jgi:hypothetical protein
MLDTRQIRIEDDRVKNTYRLCDFGTAALIWLGTWVIEVGILALIGAWFP